MIGLILGTSEGKNILSLLNEFTEDILITTATAYGGDILKEYKYKTLNTKPLDIDGLKDLFMKQAISTLVDASHPYATEITSNCKKVCEDMQIEYLRYERPSISDKYINSNKFISANSYEELIDKIISIKELEGRDGVILNTTGSKNIDKIMSWKLLNRIVHRVLPSSAVIKECLDLGVAIEDIIAIKGPIGYELNLGFIKQYKAKGIILKDSGILGGTEEKIKAALHENIYIFVIERKKEQFKNIFYSEKELVSYIRKNNLY
ncbi:MAG: cobalt-precorrin-6A reductase [Clostridiaceae bacterium]|nr:cobalt-precorrin-6A reductase [Clostridiaceae bacterium]